MNPVSSVLIDTSVWSLALRRLSKDLNREQRLLVGEWEELIRQGRVIQCRANGIAATSVDLLLCAVSVRLGVAIFTTDKDFTHYARCLPIRLHTPAAKSRPS